MKYLLVEEIYGNNLITNTFNSLEEAQEYLKNMNCLCDNKQPNDKAYITEIKETYTFKVIDKTNEAYLYGFTKDK